MPAWFPKDGFRPALLEWFWLPRLKWGKLIIVFLWLALKDLKNVLLWRPNNWMCFCCQYQHSPRALLLLSARVFLGHGMGRESGCEKPQRIVFCFAFFFFFSCSWLTEQVDGKYWAIYLTTLFLNFLISNAVLFIRSFEIFASTQNTDMNSQCRYLLSNPTDVSPIAEPTCIRLTWSDS